MKEISVEQKAKLYDEAIIRGSRLWESDMITRENYEYIFPEVKESEDERIRKHLIKHFGNKSKEDWNGVPVKSILAWLEKQGEQNHAWSEEDEKHIMAIDLAVNRCDGKWNCCGEKCPISEHSPWFKSLKDRVQLQPKQEWSEEDEKMCNDTINFIETGWTDNGKSHLIPWLKSLKGRYTWKPSDLQIAYLSKVIFTLGNEGDCATAAELRELRDNLEMLREK